MHIRRLAGIVALSCCSGRLCAAPAAPSADSIAQALAARRVAVGPVRVWAGRVTAIARTPDDGPAPAGPRIVVYTSAFQATAGVERPSANWYGTRTDDGVWRVVYGPPGTAPRTEQIVPPEPPRIERVAADRDAPLALHLLGLAAVAGGTLLAELEPPYELGPERSLGGVACLALAGRNGELWLAPALGYAPLRLLVRRDEVVRVPEPTVLTRGTTERDRRVASLRVYDWAGYDAAADLPLPSAMTLRDATRTDGGPVRAIALCYRIAKVERGPAALAAVDDLAEIGHLGLNPRLSLTAALGTPPTAWGVPLGDLFGRADAMPAYLGPALLRK